MFSKHETAKVKGIAILLLLFHHMFYNVERVQNSGMQFVFLEPDIIQPIAVSARICVWLFIFVSAYGLTYQYTNRKEENALSFIIKRWIALMKTYWIVYVIVFVMYWIVKGNVIELYENSPIRIVLDFMGWSDFFGSKMILGVWWYMCFAQILIAFIPFVCCFCEKLGWSSCIVVFVALQYLPDGIKSANGGRYSNYFLVVTVAVLCVQNKIFDKILKKSHSSMKQGIGLMITLFTIVVLLMLKLRLTDIDDWQINSFISAIVTFLICFVTSKYCTNRILTKILCFLGKHSGNMFMLHAFFYTFLPEIIYFSKSAIISYLTLLAVSLGFSVILEMIKKVIGYNEGFQKLTVYVIGKIKFVE